MIRFTRLLGMLGAAALAATLVATQADARAGGGGSMGSRGMRTFSAPAVTPTAPNAAAPIQRTITQPNVPGTTVTRPAAGGGLFNRPGGLFGGGLLGGLAAGFIGAGLFGLLFGHGLFGGLGGFASLLGLLLQIGVVVLVARLIWTWWQRRQQPAMAGGPSLRDSFGSTGGGFGGLGNSGAPASPSVRADDVGVAPADYDAFERLLADVQSAYGDEDQATLRERTTPEMFGYMQEDLAKNASRGVVNRISDVKLLQGDLAEAWSEGETEYATVAMRYTLVDRTLDRSSGRLVEGTEHPQDVTEAWTFARRRGGPWLVSAIQQV